MSGETLTRNYGDERILWFERMAQDWESSVPNARNPSNHLHHAKAYRKRAKDFRLHHDKDPHWRDKKDYPRIEVGKRYQTRCGQETVFIEGLIPVNHPERSNFGYIFISDDGRFYTEGGRCNKDVYQELPGDLVCETSFLR